MTVISSDDISVIVQGAINSKNTLSCLKRIRKYLPASEIILSTWEGSDVSTLSGLYDKLILNTDPGAVLREENVYGKIFNNLNRQLLSTQAGLKLATRKYSLKFRTDLILTSNKFLKYFDSFPCRTQDYKLFEHKILTSALFSKFYLYYDRKEKRWVNVPFHISDWWLFGLTNDLKTYFLDTKLVEEPEFTTYFNLTENKNKITPYGEIKSKFAPEQYFGYSCFSRNFDDIFMQDAADYSEKTELQSRKCIINNFIILQYKQSGIYLNKYPYSKNEKFFGELYLGLYNNFRFETEYKKFCDPNYKTSFDDSVIGNLKIEYALLRIYKHISVLTNPQTPLPKKLEQIFLSIPLTSIAFIKEFIVSKILK